MQLCEGIESCADRVCKWNGGEWGRGGWGGGAAAAARLIKQQLGVYVQSRHCTTSSRRQQQQQQQQLPALRAVCTHLSRTRQGVHAGAGQQSAPPPRELPLRRHRAAAVVGLVHVFALRGWWE